MSNGLKAIEDIRKVFELLVKKNKNLHSSKLNKDEKKIFEIGKLFKLEPEQNDELYYRIKI